MLQGTGASALTHAPTRFQPHIDQVLQAGGDLGRIPRDKPAIPRNAPHLIVRSDWPLGPTIDLIAERGRGTRSSGIAGS